MHNQVPNDTVECCASTSVFWVLEHVLISYSFLLHNATRVIVDPALIYRKEYSFCTTKQNKTKQEAIMAPALSHIIARL
jgi:hypothetical protein